VSSSSLPHELPQRVITPILMPTLLSSPAPVYPGDRLTFTWKPSQVRLKRGNTNTHTLDAFLFALSPHDCCLGAEESLPLCPVVLRNVVAKITRSNGYGTYTYTTHLSSSPKHVIWILCLCADGQSEWEEQFAHGSEYGGSRASRNSAVSYVICRKAHSCQPLHTEEEMNANKPPQLVARPQRRPQVDERRAGLWRVAGPFTSSWACSNCSFARI